MAGSQDTGVTAPSARVSGRVGAPLGFGRAGRFFAFRALLARPGNERSDPHLAADEAGVAQMRHDPLCR